MSARQPFVPSRSASRTAQREDATGIGPASQEFVPEPSSALHRDTAESNKYAGINKPLNIAKFLQKADSQTHVPLTPRKSFENHARTADMHADGSHENSSGAGIKRGQTPHIVSPTPSRLRSSTPAVVFTVDHAVFKTPNLPSAFAKPAPISHTGTNGIDAHIATHDASLDVSDSYSCGNFLDVTSQPRSDSAGYLGQFIDPADKNEHQGFAHNSRLAKNTGPLRVPVDTRPRIFGRRKTLENVKSTEDISNGTVLGTVGRKRSRTEQAEEGEEELVHNNIKRYRYEADDDVRHNGRWKLSEDPDPGICPGSPDRPSSYHRETTHSPRVYYERHHSGSTLPLSPQSNQEQIRAQVQKAHHLDQQRTTGSAWESLLGEYAESYIIEQADVIENARKRWEATTFEEWVAGADEVTQMFAKVIDYAKDHMLTKMKLYVSFDEKVESHKAVLGKQGKTLAQVKEGVVKSGTSMVSGGE